MMTEMRALILILASIVALGAGVADARAGSMDHERARAAMESGEIMALREILLAVEDEFEGRVIEVKLTDLEAGLHGWVYDVTLLTPQNNVLRVRVDAGTAVILQVEGQGVEEARKRP
jgi:uncharacterized membrane protein YkoI